MTEQQSTAITDFGAHWVEVPTVGLVNMQTVVDVYQFWKIGWETPEVLAVTEFTLEELKAVIYVIKSKQVRCCATGRRPNRTQMEACGSYFPTRHAIRHATRKIQSTWSSNEELHRSTVPPIPFLPPVCMSILHNGVNEYCPSAEG